MNKKLKVILVIINSIMLLLAINWYKEKGETEPIIVFFGQLAVLIGLVFEKQVSNIKIKKIHDNSDVDVDVQTGDNVSASNVKKSSVKIKTKE